MSPYIDAMILIPYTEMMIVIISLINTKKKNDSEKVTGNA